MKLDGWMLVFNFINPKGKNEQVPLLCLVAPEPSSRLLWNPNLKLVHQEEEGKD